MAQFADDRETIEIQTYECRVIYAAKFKDDFVSVNFTIAGIPEDVFESTEDDALRNCLEEKGKPILNGILSEEFKKLTWELEDFD